MVIGCIYSKTHDIHRLIPGKDGGGYNIGNAFMLCPNHHVEAHRNIVELRKINNFEVLEIAI